MLRVTLHSSVPYYCAFKSYLSRNWMTFKWSWELLKFIMNTPNTYCLLQSGFLRLLRGMICLTLVIGILLSLFLVHILWKLEYSRTGYSHRTSCRKGDLKKRPPYALVIGVQKAGTGNVWQPDWCKMGYGIITIVLITYLKHKITLLHSYLFS